MWCTVTIHNIIHHYWVSSLCLVSPGTGTDHTRGVWSTQLPTAAGGHCLAHSLWDYSPHSSGKVFYKTWGKNSKLFFPVILIFNEAIPWPLIVNRIVELFMFVVDINSNVTYCKEKWLFFNVQLWTCDFMFHCCTKNGYKKCEVSS